MSKQKPFPFDKARRITMQETKAAQTAIQKVTGKKRKNRGRPNKGINKYQPISIRLHPDIISWAKEEAKKRGVGYQTVINLELLKKAA